MSAGASARQPPGAIEALSKGKVSTQPDRHSGEGIFFYVEDGSAFSLEANGFLWLVDNVPRRPDDRDFQDDDGHGGHFEVLLERS